MVGYTDAVTLSLATGSAVQARVNVGGGPAKPRCLLLHGNPGSLLDWGPLTQLLAGAADVVAIDMPGFGKSPRPGSASECLSLVQLAQHVIAAADALGWSEPFYLLGHSHGGGVAQVVAARYPERVAGIVLIATIGAPTHRSYRLLSLPGAETFARLAGAVFRTRLLRPLSRAILRLVMRDIWHPERVSAERLEQELNLFALRPSILISMVHVALGRPCEQLFESASGIRCPALFIHGAKDVLVPVASARSIHERIGNGAGDAHFEVLPTAGHMLIQYQASDLAGMILRHINAGAAAR